MTWKYSEYNDVTFLNVCLMLCLDLRVFEPRIKKQYHNSYVQYLNLLNHISRLKICTVLL